MKNFNNEVVEKHINSKIEEFKNKIIKIAKDNQYPFIGAILRKSIKEFQKAAISNKGNVECDEQKFLF